MGSMRTRAGSVPRGTDPSALRLSAITGAPMCQHCPTCRRNSLLITRSRSAARSGWRARPAIGFARNTRRLPPGSDWRYPRVSSRSRRFTRFLVTADPTARLTTNPTLGGCSAAPAPTSRWPTTVGRPARAPLRTVRVNSALRRIRAGGGRIRHSASRGPYACVRRARHGRPGCACAAGSHASSRGADCSAGTCAYSLGLQGTLYDDGRIGNDAVLTGRTVDQVLPVDSTQATIWNTAVCPASPAVAS
jgi:hypothetical protein